MLGRTQILELWEGGPRDRVTPGRKQGVRGQGYSICKWMARTKPEFFIPSPLEVRKGSTLLSAGPQLPLYVTTYIWRVQCQIFSFVIHKKTWVWEYYRVEEDGECVTCPKS